MRLYLDFIEGPMAGKKVSLTEKTTFGRAQADVVIADAKLSGTHAYFDFDKFEGWSVVDDKSRNGLWINGHKEIKSHIKNGDVIQMGDSKIRCRLIEGDKHATSEKFQKWVQSLVKKLKNQPSEMIEIKPEIRLKVIQGIQYGETWDLFYGPRRAGRENLDICLYDDKAPKDSFEIRVKGSYAYFHTEHERIVKLNNESIKSKQIAPGDIISIGESQIMVEFDEGHGFSS